VSQNNNSLIMIVDDTPVNLEILSLILQRNNYRVAEFPKGSLALKSAAVRPPDLILLDIMMPEMDGFEFCQKLKEDQFLKEIPVIFISALNDTENKVKAFTHGGVDYINKPFHKEEVLSRVQVHLNLRRQHQEIIKQKEMLQRSYDELKMLELQRDKLVHMIVHDMRSPLMGLLGSAEMLEMSIRDLDQPEMKTDIEMIQACGNTIKEMITTLLDISRMESGQMPVYKKHSRIGDIFHHAQRNLGSLLTDVTINAIFPTSLAEASCDPDLTARIFQNLLGNAAKFAGSKCIIEIKVEDTENRLKISISDNGPGIPQDYQNKIFDKFSQVMEHKAGRKDSTGLGLTFCKLAVESQGGKIGVESSPGNGCVFWFTVEKVPS